MITSTEDAQNEDRIQKRVNKILETRLETDKVSKCYFRKQK